VKLAIEVFPAASATEQLTVVVPFGKLEPEAGVQTGVPTPGQLSATVGAAKDTVAAQVPAATLVVMFAGGVMVGNCVSFTVTVNVANPPPEALVQDTVVTPFGKTLPEAGVQVTAPQVPPVVGAG